MLLMYSANIVSTKGLLNQMYSARYGGYYSILQGLCLRYGGFLCARSRSEIGLLKYSARIMSKNGLLMYSARIMCKL